MSNFRPNLDRTLIYFSPYVKVDNTITPVKASAKHPTRWLNTLRCNRHKSETIRMPTKDECVTCDELQPYFYKQNNYLNPKGFNYRDVMFSGDFDHEYYHGCLDPRDGNFDSFAGVHCPDRCAGKQERAPCCLTLDLNVLDESNCERDRKAKEAAEAFAKTPEGIALAAAAKQPLANYPPLNPNAVPISYAYGAPVFMNAMNAKTMAAIELIK